MSKTNKQSSLGKLWAYMARYKVQIFLVVLFSVLGAAFSIAGPKMLGLVTTEIFQNVMNPDSMVDWSMMERLTVILLAVYVISAVFSGLQGVIMRQVAQNVSYQLRKDVMEKINRLPLSYFDGSPIGETLSKVTNDVDLISQNLNQTLTMVISSVITILGVLVIMLTISIPMTLAAFMMLPLSALLVRIIVRFSQKYFADQQKNLGEVNGNIEEMYTGQLVVKAFGAERKTVEHFEKINGSLYNTAWKSQFFSGIMMPLLMLVGNLGYVAMAVLGGALAAQNIIQVGDILAFVQYVRNLNQPIGQTAQIASLLQATIAAADRVFGFLEEPEETDEASDCCELDHSGGILFENVSFGYNPDRMVIRDFSLDVRSGSTVAIVGHTGAGKTTIVKLLMRFYDIQKGLIKIGGRDIKSVHRKELRDSFGMVLQDTWLFNGTIMENIRYAKHDATDEEVIEAAKKAQADSFIRQLPNGYQMLLSDDAGNISEGQKQLITIARAILKNPDILILDEATSSVDTRTEAMIQSAMKNLMKGRTNFVIAHRLSTIRNADSILVMENGNIVEQGDHKSLLALGGRYTELYQSQFE